MAARRKQHEKVAICAIIEKAFFQQPLKKSWAGNWQKACVLLRRGFCKVQLRTKRASGIKHRRELTGQSPPPRSQNIYMDSVSLSTWMEREMLLPLVDRIFEIWSFSNNVATSMLVAIRMADNIFSLIVTPIFFLLHLPWHTVSCRGHEPTFSIDFVLCLAQMGLCPQPHLLVILKYKLTYYLRKCLLLK